MQAVLADSLKVSTRAKQLVAGGAMSSTRVVELSIKMLEAYFAQPLCIAAERLGISLTAFKW
jgi:hypothetical protein